MQLLVFLWKKCGIHDERLRISADAVVNSTICGIHDFTSRDFEMPCCIHDNREGVFSYERHIIVLKHLKASNTAIKILIKSKLELIKTCVRWMNKKGTLYLTTVTTSRVYIIEGNSCKL